MSDMASSRASGYDAWHSSRLTFRGVDDVDQLKTSGEFWCRDGDFRVHASEARSRGSHFEITREYANM